MQVPAEADFIVGVIRSVVLIGFAVVLALATALLILCWVSINDTRAKVFSYIVGAAMNLAVLYFLVRFVKWAWYR
jgi:hypothetical protein